MKTRRAVRIKCLPSGGRYQIFLLREQVTGCFFGPYVWDCQSKSIVPFRDIDFFVDRYDQGPRIIGKESNFLHHYAEGTLNAYYGFISSQVEYDEEFSDSPPVARAEVQCTLFESLDAHKKPYQPPMVRTYERGSDVVAFDSLYLPRTHVVERSFDEDGNLIGLFFSGTDRWLVFSWPTNEYSSTMVESYNITFPDQLESAYDEETQSYTLSVHHERYVDGEGSMVRNVAMTFNPWYLTPAICTELDYGQYAQRQISKVEPYIRSDLRLVSHVHSDYASTEALMSACDGFALANVNGITFIQDIGKLKDTFGPLIQVLLKPLSVKKWADLLLSLKYGIRLTWADGKAILAALRSLRRTAKTLREYQRRKTLMTTKYGEFSEVSRTATLFVKCRSNARVTAQLHLPEKNLSDWELLVSMLEDLGLRLSFTNIWDMLPYSFVVDWFTGISSLCQRVDFFDFSGRYWLREIVASQRNKCDTDDDRYLRDCDFYGSLHLDTYRRWVSVKFPKLSWIPKKGNPLRHITEGVLLIIQQVIKD